jgi:hypothetical protein
MPRRKRNSSVLERAERRFESLQSIDTFLDLGGGLSLDAYATTINDLRSKLAVYNTALSTIDKMADEVNSAEQLVLELSEKMLLGIGSRYGRTSQEYGMAGGSRRKRSRLSAGSSLAIDAAQAAPAQASSNGTSATVSG